MGNWSSTGSEYVPEEVTVVERKSMEQKHRDNSNDLIGMTPQEANNRIQDFDYYHEGKMIKRVEDYLNSKSNDEEGTCLVEVTRFNKIRSIKKMI